MASVLDLFIVVFLITAVMFGMSIYLGKPIMALLPTIELGAIPIHRYTSPLIQLTWKLTLVSYVPTVVFILYSAIFERLPSKASPGKYVMGLEVIDTESYTTTFGQSLRRNIFKFLPWFVVATGVLSALHMTAFVPIVAENLPLIFLALISTASALLVVNIFMILLSESRQGMHCYLTDTAVSRKLNYSRDNVIFFFLLTLVLLAMSCVYTSEMIRYVFHKDVKELLNSIVSTPLISEQSDQSTDPAPEPEALVEPVPSPSQEPEVQEEEVSASTEEEPVETEPSPLSSPSPSSSPVPERDFPSLSVTESIQTLSQSDEAIRQGEDAVRWDLEKVSPVTKEFARGKISMPGIRVALKSARATAASRAGTLTVLLSQYPTTAKFPAAPVAKVTFYFKNPKSTCDSSDLARYEVKLLQSAGATQASYAKFAVDTDTFSALQRVQISCSRGKNGWIRIALKGGRAYLNEGVRGAVTWNIYAEAFLRNS